MLNSFRTWMSLRKVLEYGSSDAQLLVGDSLRVYLAKGARIFIQKGQVRLAFHLSKDQMFSTKSRTCLYMEENSTLIFKGDAHVSPGATIRIKKNATLEVGERCVLAHDALIYCSQKIKLGNDVSLSWNVTLIDDDQHQYYIVQKELGARPMRRIYKPLIIEDFAGIQMNVVVPHGQIIGSGSIVAANTVLRQDVPAESLVYVRDDLRVKANVTTPVQFSSSQL
jgi:acetyltransferase-like isoleucine patch superfamily enzyme